MLDVLVVCTAVAVGLLGGWWLRGTDPRYIRTRSRSDDSARANEILERLQTLTHDVAADVDKHKVMMRQVSDELHSLDNQDPEVVVSAVGKLIQFNERMQEQLDSAEQKLQHQAREIKSHVVEARTDPLTNLANRRAFDDAMAGAHESFIDRNWPTTIMMIDLDHFKNLNDTYGHQAGDEVLRGVGRILSDHVPQGNLIARYGGEEFAIIFPNADIGDVAGIIERARRAIGRASFEFESLGLCITASGGVAQFRSGEDAAALIGRADEALYVSKETGRDRCHVHDGNTVVPLDERVDPDTPVADTVEPADHTEAGISSPEVFYSDVRRRLSDWKRGGAPLCVLFIQIDDLNEIRRRYGDDNRDAVYRALTLTVKAAMREMDHAAKFEGETISLLLPGCTLRGAMSVAERLRTAANRCELSKKHEQRQFTVSIGVAEALDGEDEQQLVDRVRESLIAAKTHGQDCTYVHDGLACHLIGAGRVTMMA